MTLRETAFADEIAEIMGEDPPDTETIVTDCYNCGCSFDTGIATTGRLTEPMYCGLCDEEEDL